MKIAMYQHHGHRALVGEVSYFFYLILIASATVLIMMIVSVVSQRFEREPTIFSTPTSTPFVETSNDFAPVN